MRNPDPQSVEPIVAIPLTRNSVRTFSQPTLRQVPGSEVQYRYGKADSEAVHPGAIRRDGAEKHAEMKQRLDTVDANNLKALALLEAYLPHAKTPALLPALRAEILTTQ